MYQIVCIMRDWHIIAPNVQFPAYETENNATEIVILGRYDVNCTYELHREINGDKRYFIMSVDLQGLHLPMPAGFLTEVGTYHLQLKGTYPNGSVKISNEFSIKVDRFIAAEDEDDPEAPTVLDQIRSVVAQYSGAINGFDERLTAQVTRVDRLDEKIDNTETDLEDDMEALETRVGAQLTTVSDALDGMSDRFDGYDDALGNLGVDNFSLALKKRALAGGCISPIYVGDFLSDMDHLPSCVLRLGDVFYAVDAPTRAAALSGSTNEGVIRKFDLETNMEVVAEAITTNVGHANSIAYDASTSTIYIAPIWNTSTGEEVEATYLYKLDSSLQAAGTEEIPTVAMGVSYDPVRERLYFVDHTGHVYAKTDGNWALYTTINMTGLVENQLWSRVYTQDFAVYDGVFYISSPYGNIIYGDLTPTDAFITSSYICGYTDTTGRFILGELEGMEFTSDGHLYAVNYVDLSDEVRNAFIVELPVKTHVEESSNLAGFFGVHDGTLVLSSEAQTKFALLTYEIRTLLQLMDRLLDENSPAVTIPANDVVNDPYTIRITKGLTLELNGQYSAATISVLNGNFNIFAANANNRLTLTEATNHIRLGRSGRLTISGDYALNVSIPNYTSGDFIWFGTYKPFITIRTIPVCIQTGTALLMGGKDIAAGVFCGANKLDGGEYKSVSMGGSGETVNITASEIKECARLELDAGSWMVFGIVVFQAGGSSGGTYRIAMLGTPTVNNLWGSAHLPSCSAGNTNAVICIPIYLTEPTTVVLRAQQGSGSTIPIYAGATSLRAVRIA